MLDNVTALIGDNCSTNQSIATKLKTPLLGCESPRFQLPVTKITAEEEEVVQKGSQCDGQNFGHHIFAQNFRENLQFYAKLRNDTR